MSSCIGWGGVDISLGINNGSSKDFLNTGVMNFFKLFKYRCCLHKQLFPKVGRMQVVKLFVFSSLLFVPFFSTVWRYKLSAYLVLSTV